MFLTETIYLLPKKLKDLIITNMKLKNALIHLINLLYNCFKIILNQFSLKGIFQQNFNMGLIEY
jgi:hypothetical protein